MIRISELRQAAGFTQENLAQRSNIPWATIAHMESPDFADLIPLAQLEALAKALSVQPHEIVSGLKKADITLLREIGSLNAEDLEDFLDGDKAGELAALGVDPDPRTWTVSIHLRSGRVRQYRISSSAVYQIEVQLEAFNEDDGDRFVMFDSRECHLAVNAEHIVAIESECFAADDPGASAAMSDFDSDPFAYTVSLNTLAEDLLCVPGDPEDVLGEDYMYGLFASELENRFVRLNGVGGASAMLGTDHIELIEVPYALTIGLEGVGEALADAET